MSLGAIPAVLQFFLFIDLLLQFAVSFPDPNRAARRARVANLQSGGNPFGAHGGPTLDPYREHCLALGGIRLCRWVEADQDAAEVQRAFARNEEAGINAVESIVAMDDPDGKENGNVFGNAGFG